MRVLVLGGTGSIGAPVVRALVGRGHDVVALARSDRSAARAVGLGANPVAGDIATPERWRQALPPLDAVIHLACDFDGTMADVDRRLLDGLLPHLAAQPNQATFIYTGGCWLFGATGDDVASEQAPFRPLPAFAWMVSHLQRVLETEGVARSSFIRPWCTSRQPACSLSSSPRLASGGDPRGRWRARALAAGPSRGYANLYVLALERGTSRTSYIGAAIPGFPVGRIARAIAQRFGLRDHAPQLFRRCQLPNR